MGGDIMAGGFAFILSVYAANHFRILLGLKEEVDKYAKLDNHFKSENAMLRTQVSKLTKAQQELSSVAVRLKETTKSYDENILKFRALDEKLSNLGDDNIKGLQRLHEMTHTVADSIEKELIQHQRDINASSRNHGVW